MARIRALAPTDVAVLDHPMTGALPPNIRAEAESTLLPRTPGLLVTSKVTTSVPLLPDIPTPCPLTTSTTVPLSADSPSHTPAADDANESRTPAQSEDSEEEDLATAKTPLSKQGPPSPKKKTPVRRELLESVEVPDAPLVVDAGVAVRSQRPKPHPRVVVDKDPLDVDNIPERCRAATRFASVEEGDEDNEMVNVLGKVSACESHCFMQHLITLLAALYDMCSS